VPFDRYTFWYLAHFFLEWGMFQTEVVEEIKIGILCSVSFSRKSCRLTDIHFWSYLAVLLRMRNVSDKSCRENQNTHFVFNNFFFRKSCRLWDNVQKYGTARQATYGNITWRMRFACWITKATDTHSEYVILIAFPRQQWLRERASMLMIIRTLRVLPNSSEIAIRYTKKN
jgi:hypothetical protein